MGLDQYAYTAARAGQQAEYYDSYEGDNGPDESLKPREIAYWRKHPNLQGWMEQLWFAKRNAENRPVVEDAEGLGGTFNGVELELTWEDIEALERDVSEGKLPATQGFFFGDNSDEFYKQDDLDFIKQAKAELFVGLKVFYNSSW